MPERSTYGQPWLPNLHETEHFAVTWDEGHGNQAAAASAAEAMEEAWVALVDEQGWTPPVSSDDYLIWVILDRGLSGTGVTPEYTTEDYPQGYPVIYLNPDYASSTVFWSHLSAHELAHALQYAERDDYSSSGAEAWYWEASAEWQVEQSLPELNDYARQTEYYATQTSARFDSMEGWHQYGMVAFNAWLDEAFGPAQLQAIWASSGSGADWIELLEEGTGLGAGQMWGEFTAAYGNNQLDESNLQWDVEVVGKLEDGSSGSVAELGTDFYQVRSDTGVRVTGEVILSAPWGEGEHINVQTGDVLGVTGLSGSMADYSLEFTDWIEPVDSGGWDSDTGGPLDTGEGEDPRGCGCASTGAPLGWLPALVLLVLVRFQLVKR